MSWADAAWHRALVFVRGERYAREQMDELRTHLEMEAQQHYLNGNAEARRRMGNLTGVQEQLRDAAGMAWLDRFKQDLTYAIRGLRRSPGFTIMVIITLSLGVGANAAIFSMLDRLYFRNPPGVVDPGGVRRVYLYEPDPFAGVGMTRALQRFTYPEYEAMKQAIGNKAAFAADIPPGAFVGHRVGDPHVTFVTPGYFDLLGVTPAAGRFFSAEESPVDVDARVAVITHAFWKSRFGLDPSVVGKTVDIYQRPYRIVGVATPGFNGIDVQLAEAFLPMGSFPVSARNGVAWYMPGTQWSPFRPVMRTGSGSNEIPLLELAYAAKFNAARDRERTDAVPRKLAGGPLVAARGPAKNSHEISLSARFAGVTMIVLFIACANIASLLLVRATKRRREIAVRLALGVTRRQLWGQMVTESVTLAAIGCGFALITAQLGGAALRKLLLPETVFSGPPVDLRVAAFTIATAMLVGVIAGLAPAFHATRTDLQDALKSGALDSVRRSFLRSSLLAAQGAMAIVLLVGAGLFIRTLGNVQSLPLGFDAQRMVHATVQGAPDSAGPRIAAALNEAATRMAGVPGMRGTTIAVDMPMSGNRTGSLRVPGRDSIRVGTYGNHVAHNFFSVLAMPFIAGRAFTRDETENQAAVVIVNQQLARNLWPGENAIGKCVIVEKAPGGPCSLVIGVTANTRTVQIIEATTSAQYFAPLAATTGFYRPNVLVMNADPEHAEEIAKRAKVELDQLLPGIGRVIVRRSSVSLDPQYRPWRVGAQLFSAFGLLALIVAAIGIYSVVSYSVSQRTREMGVRVALGAHMRDVLDLVVGDGMRVVGIGIAVGIAIVLVLGKFIASQLFGVTPHDPFVMLGAASVLMAAGVAAAIIPAWRAARVDPMTTLRSE